MRKICFIIFLSYGIAFYSLAQTISYDSFDSQGLVNWIFIDNNKGGMFNPEMQNPSNDILNDSDVVAKFTKPAEAPAEVFFFMEKPFDLTQNALYSLHLYGKAGTKINMKLQHNDLNYMAHLTEVVKSYEIQETDTWEQANFDFTDYNARTDLDKLVIEIDTSHHGEETILFDNLTGPVYHDTVEITYAFTSFDGCEVNVKVNKFMNSLPELSGFSLQVNETPVTLTSVAVVDSFEKIISLSPESCFEPSDNIHLSYADGNIESIEGWLLKEYFNIPVINAADKDTVLVWSDEFNNDFLDTTIWTRLEGEYWFNEELQAYTKSSANSYCEDGKLKITARKEKYGIRDYTSARIVSRYNADFRYGRFEASIKMPEGKGIWPAFWMMPTEDKYGTWPSSGEIDIMEFLGHELTTNHGAIHYGNGLGYRHEQQHGAYYDRDAKRNEGFHVYAIEWEPGIFRWYFNGKRFHTATAKKTSFHWPFDQDFHFILNVAVGGRWPGNPNETTVFPQTLEVDYVRVYKYNTQKNNTNSITFGANDNKINIFPNPVEAGQRLHIEPIQEKKFTLVVYGFDGRVKHEKTYESYCSTVDPGFLTPGIYIVKIIRSEKTYTTKLIIK